MHSLNMASAMMTAGSSLNAICSKSRIVSFLTRPMSYASMFTSSAKEKRRRFYKVLHEKRLNAIKSGDDKDAQLVFEYASEQAMTRVYTWGQACSGALGVRQYLRPQRFGQNVLKQMHRPARCPVAEGADIVDVACGYGFTVFAAKNSKADFLGCGNNVHGQIGYHSPRVANPLITLIEPVPIRLPKAVTGKVVNVACGRAHTLALTSSSQVLSLGNNAYGQCGRPIVENEDYFRSNVVHVVKGPWSETNEQISNITCGQDHSLLVSDKGNIYAFGWGADGQCGHGHYEHAASPVQVEGDVKGTKIVKVASAADCVLALSEQGEVFGWGNSEYGQLSMVSEEQQICLPQKLPLDHLGKIIDIACGGTICLVLNENHDVFVWGYGILGKGPNLDFSKQPEQIPGTLFGSNAFNNNPVKALYAGLHTNAAVNTLGELFIWGKNKGSCLGLGEWKDQLFPLKVNIANEVKKISLGPDHTAAICKAYA